MTVHKPGSKQNINMSKTGTNDKPRKEILLQKIFFSILSHLYMRLNLDCGKAIINKLNLTKKQKQKKKTKKKPFVS